MVENRSLRRRLVGLAAIGFYFFMALTWKRPGAWYFGDYVPIMICSRLIFGTFLVIGLQALLESPVNLVATAMPWVKRGWWGRLAGRFFYVGWPSGVLYLVTLLVLFGGGLAWCWIQAMTANVSRTGLSFEIRDRELATMIAGFGALLGLLPVPLVLWQLFLRQRLPWHFGIYTLILGVLAALELGIIALASGLDSPNLLKLGLPIPTMSWPWLASAHSSWYYRKDEMMDWGYGEITVISGCVSVFWWIMALFLSRRAFRETRAVEREAAALLKQPAASLPAPGNG
jgi:hypothetical protein